MIKIRESGLDHHNSVWVPKLLSPPLTFENMHLENTRWKKDVMHTPTTPRHVGLGSIAHTQKMSLCLVLLLSSLLPKMRYYVVR